MAYDECVKKAIKDWPLAYGKCIGGSLVGGVKLEKHLELTAILVKHLVETRFPPYTIRDVLPEVFKYIDPIDFAYTIGLLHDVGKASMYYLEHYVESLKRSKGEIGEKISFPYHEFALALIMLHAIDMHATELDEASLVGMDLSARIISRHHSAMPDRHPLEYDPRSCRTSGVLKEVLKSMCRSEVANFVGKLRDLCNNLELCRRALSVLETHLRDDKNCLELSRAFSVPFSKLKGFRSVSGMPRLDELAVYRLIVVYTGLLIVGDNIAASRENRISDDESTPIFVKHWLRELSGILN
jgi:CRISPR/Cas system-associated endonuclease Cas3-HD